MADGEVGVIHDEARDVNGDLLVSVMVRLAPGLVARMMVWPGHDQGMVFLGDRTFGDMVTGDPPPGHDGHYDLRGRTADWLAEFRADPRGVLERLRTMEVL